MNKLKEWYYKSKLRSIGKKPQGKIVLYITYIALPWIFSGFLVVFLLALVYARASGDLVNPSSIDRILVVLFVLTALHLAFTIHTDVKRGYLDAIYQHYLGRRKENLEKIHDKLGIQEIKKEV